MLARHVLQAPVWQQMPPDPKLAKLVAFLHPSCCPEEDFVASAGVVFLSRRRSSLLRRLCGLPFFCDMGGSMFSANLSDLRHQGCLLVSLVSGIISPITFIWGGSWVRTSGTKRARHPHRSKCRRKTWSMAIAQCEGCWKLCYLRIYQVYVGSPCTAWVNCHQGSIHWHRGGREYLVQS